MTQVGRALRLVSAFVVAPLIASALVGLSVAAVIYKTEDPPFSGDALLQLRNLALVVALFAALVAVPSALSLGLIAHTVLMRARLTGVWPYIAAGALAGCLVPLIFTPFMAGSFFFALYGVPTGILTALFAWLIPRPDRDAPNPPTSGS